MSRFVFVVVILTCFTQIILVTLAENTYLEPATKYFVEIEPKKSDKGIAIENSNGRRVTFKHSDFFRIFPRIIISDLHKPDQTDIIRFAASFNKNNQNSRNFLPAEVWWQISSSKYHNYDNIRDGLNRINQANSLSSGTVSTVYLIIDSRHENITAQVVNSHVRNLSKEIRKSGSRNLSIAVEIRGKELSCKELLSFPTARLTSIIVWLYGNGAIETSESLNGLVQCQQQLNSTKTKFILRGASGYTTYMRYWNGSLKLWCESGNSSHVMYPCKYVKLENYFANNVSSHYAIYHLDHDDSGIFGHPKRVLCGLPENELHVWSRSPLRLSKYSGFSVSFDSKAINYTTSTLRELAKISPNIIVENQYELTNSSETQLIYFVEEFAKLLNEFSKNYHRITSDSSEFLRTRSILIKIDVKATDDTDQDFISELVEIAVRAANKANDLSPRFVYGIVFSFGWHEIVASYIITAFNEIRTSPDWRQEIKLGVSIESGCTDWLANSRGVDLILYESSIKLSKQCLSKIHPKFLEETSRDSDFLNCKNSQSVSKEPVELAFNFQIGWCRPKWQTNDEMDVQYGLAIERLSEISDEYGIRFYVGSAFQEDTTSLSDSCGWWRFKDKGKLNKTDKSLEDRKAALQQSFALRLAENEKIKTVTKIETKTNTIYSYIVDSRWLWYLTPVVVICLVGVLLSVCLAFRYKRKLSIRYQELCEFLKEGRTSDESDTMVGGNADALALKYDKEKFEVSAHRYIIDLTKCYGSGEFGMVCHALVIKGSESISVAVKTIKRQMNLQESVGALRGLISEIKILSYIGEHPNVVRLIGAYTEKLREGYIAVFLELCPKGSLLKILRNFKSKLMAKSKQSKLMSALKDSLMQWSYEIVKGMAFLASRKVVHSDLAARNILLDSNYVAKIADFGLSRRLYDFNNYAKKNRDPLPWRWMAPEALQSLQFNEKTDAWSVGITFWEIFTLGDIPYPGLSWNINFVDQLSDGLRPPEPIYNQNEMYSLMLRCWDTEPDQRPTFAQLEEEFENDINGKQECHKYLKDYFEISDEDNDGIRYAEVSF